MPLGSLSTLQFLITAPVELSLSCSVCHSHLSQTLSHQNHRSTSACSHTIVSHCPDGVGLGVLPGGGGGRAGATLAVWGTSKKGRNQSGFMTPAVSIGEEVAQRCRPSGAILGREGSPMRGGGEKRPPSQSIQPQYVNYGAPPTQKRHQQEHRLHRPTECSDPMQHAKGRTGDCPGPEKK